MGTMRRVVFQSLETEGRTGEGSLQALPSRMRDRGGHSTRSMLPHARPSATGTLQSGATGFPLP